MWAAVMGKSLAVLGARGVGKTHLYKFLTSGSISPDYSQTTIGIKMSPRRFKLDTLNISIKEGMDVSGDEAAHAQWKELVGSADIVCYLMRADLILNNDVATKKRVKADINAIHVWLEEREKRGRRQDFFIVGTHCDYVDGYTSSTDDRHGDFVDIFNKHQSVRDVFFDAGGREMVKLALGSMETTQGTEDITLQIFKQVK
jgi:hypothetical protein